MTSPANLERLKSWLQKNNLKWSLMIPDVQELIDDEKSQQASDFESGSVQALFMDWVSYKSEAAILDWLKSLESRSPYCRTEIIGQTFEGRNMTIMKVSSFIIRTVSTKLLLWQGLQGWLR